MSRTWQILLIAIAAVFALLIALSVYRGAVAQELTLDTDGDGCTNSEELAYGMDPENPYDFFDTPPYDGTVTIGDLGSVIARFGLVLGDSGYYTGFDRNLVENGSIGPPDGSITIGDIGLVVSQFGRACTDVEWCSGNVQDWPPTEDSLELPEPIGEVIEGGETCYRINVDGQTVDYLIVEDSEVERVFEGETTLSELPSDLPDLQTVQAARTTAGLPLVEAQSAAAPRISHWFYSQCKTWRDGLRIPLYKICLHTRLKMLENAGFYTGLINIYEQWGSHNAWVPWRVADALPISKVYVYTDSGPWDFEIRNRKQVYMEWYIPTPIGPIVIGGKWMNASRKIQGDTDGHPNSYWRAWLE